MSAPPNFDKIGRFDPATKTWPGTVPDFTAPSVDEHMITAAPEHELAPLLSRQINSAFGQGEAAGRKGGFVSDNPHPWGGIKWEAWRAGFQFSTQSAD